jgi:hypothetical protein
MAEVVLSHQQRLRCCNADLPKILNPTFASFNAAVFGKCVWEEMRGSQLTLIPASVDLALSRLTVCLSRPGPGSLINNACMRALALRRK